MERRAWRSAASNARPASTLIVSRSIVSANIRRISFVADLLSRNGVPVITAAISPYREIRAEARELMGDRFIEVFVKASVEVCAERDAKGLYEKAFKGEIKEFTGISDPYEPPLNPEITLDTVNHSPEENARHIMAELVRLGFVRSDWAEAAPNGLLN